MVRKETEMSRIPEVKQSKYNKDDKFAWVDSQWEKFMNEQKKLKFIISELEDENKKLKDRCDELYQLYIFGTPTDGLEVGSPEDYEIDNQLNLFED